MPDKPAAEITIDERLVRVLLSRAPRAITEAAREGVEHVADGWDCAVWRVGRDYALRVPRRAVAASLIENEQCALPAIAAAVSGSAVRVPAPVFAGRPNAEFPWPWTIAPWIEGTTGLDVPRAVRRGWAQPLAEALSRLHSPAPLGHPVNPVRGVPLRERDAAFHERVALVRAAGIDTGAAERAWADGLRAPVWTGRPVWVHGDLHPGNLVAECGALRGIIDFGDVTAGDPAYDLAIAWLAFDTVGRAEFIATTRDQHDPAIWVRARAWAAAVAVLLLAFSDDSASYATLGHEALAEL